MNRDNAPSSGVGWLYTRYHDGTPGGEISSKAPIADDKWHYVVSVRSDKTKIDIYLDGKLDLENKNGVGESSTDKSQI